MWFGHIQRKEQHIHNAMLYACMLAASAVILRVVQCAPSKRVKLGAPICILAEIFASLTNPLTIASRSTSGTALNACVSVNACVCFMQMQIHFACGF